MFEHRKQAAHCPDSDIIVPDAEGIQEANNVVPSHTALPLPFPAIIQDIKPAGNAKNGRLGKRNKLLMRS